MACGESSVIFLVKCECTKPGETVCVVGGSQALGQWAPAHAVELETNASTFPFWTSGPVPLPVGQPVEFKGIVMRNKAVVRWEAFNGNRSVEVVAGFTTQVRSTWDTADTMSTNTPTAGQHVAPPSSIEEHSTLNRTMSGARIFGDQMEQMVETLKAKEPLRRNFSQSLLHLEEPETSQHGSDDDDDGGVEVRQEALPEDEEEPVVVATKSVRGVCLSHISSFSALTDMADVQTKEKIRLRRQAEYQPFNLDVPVVIVTSEVAPFSKSGGLGLVAASYSYEFARNGHRTMVISPKYRHYEGIQYVGETRVRVAGQDQLVKYWHLYKDIGHGEGGCDYLFVDHPCIERGGGGLYNDSGGREYHDNLLRFTLLSAAAMEAPLILDIGGLGTYGDKVVFIANDWQAGIVPVYLNYKYRRNRCYSQARCLYVIHNLGYQGMYHGINACEFFNIDQQAAHDLVHGKCINLTKGALICSDRVLTVSKNYAWEIQTREGGFGLDEYVKGKAHGCRLSGILNGIDDCWNPSSDAKISRRYSVANFEEGKRINKAELQKLLGLRQDPNVIVLGFIGRLTWQKGVDILADCISWLMEDNGNGITGRVQLIMMGNGEEKYANALRWAENTYRGNACGYVGFDPKVEHQMMAGCDLFVMPSRYEPCGLPQMYSQVYGTLPVVHATGGLKDSVCDISAGLDHATGFHCKYMTTDEVKKVLWHSMEIFFKQPGDFRRMQRNAMETDFYWPVAMDEYERNIDFSLYDPPNDR